MSAIYYAVLFCFFSFTVRNRYRLLTSGACLAAGRPGFVCYWNVAFWSFVCLSFFMSAVASCAALKKKPSVGIDMHYKYTTVTLMIMGTINAVDVAMVFLIRGLAASYGYSRRAVPWKLAVTLESPGLGVCCLVKRRRARLDQGNTKISSPRYLAATGAWPDLAESKLFVICVGRSPELAVDVWSRGADEACGKPHARPRTLRDLPYRSAADREKTCATVQRIPQGRKRVMQRRFNVSGFEAWLERRPWHAWSSPREMIARPNMSQIEWKSIETRGFQKLGMSQPFPAQASSTTKGPGRASTSSSGSSPPRASSR